MTPIASLGNRFARLSLQAKFQWLVQPVLAALFAGGILVIDRHLQSLDDDALRQQADDIANQVLDGANMLMLTGRAQDRDARALMLSQAAGTGNVATLRLLRAESISRQFGPGIPESQPAAPDERAALEAMRPVRAYVERAGKTYYRAVTSYAATKDFHGTNCLGCHVVPEGTVAGASVAEIDATGLVRQRERLLAGMFGGQLALHVLIWLLTGWIVRRFVQAPVDAIGELLRAIADGRLDDRAPPSTDGTFGPIVRDGNATADRLESVVGQIRRSALAIGAASDELAQDGGHLSARTSRQAESLDESAHHMKELTETVAGTAHKAQHARDLATEASECAARAGAVVAQIRETMARIERASGRITEVVALIDSIAFQTGILAVNAAVEAAGAGERGRGFAVVASEVQSLANRCVQSAREISQLVAASGTAIDAGASRVGQAGATMGEAVARIREAVRQIEEISVSTRDQSERVAGISSAIVEVDESTRDNVELAEEARRAATTLREQAAVLARETRAFSE